MSTSATASSTSSSSSSVSSRASRSTTLTSRIYWLIIHIWPRSDFNKKCLHCILQLQTFANKIQLLILFFSFVVKWTYRNMSVWRSWWRILETRSYLGQFSTAQFRWDLIFYWQAKELKFRLRSQNCFWNISKIVVIVLNIELLATGILGFRVIRTQQQVPLTSRFQTKLQPLSSKQRHHRPLEISDTLFIWIITVFYCNKAHMSKV